jgi:Fic family protein
MLDKRVAAVRADRLVGNGSEAGKVSIVENCFTDEELIDFLDREGATTPTQAVREMRAYERLMRDHESDIMNA